MGVPRRKVFIRGQAHNHDIIRAHQEYGPSNHPNNNHHPPPVATYTSYGSSSNGRAAGYNYAYSVDGGSYGPAFHKQEESNGEETEGEYSVRLPDGRLQTVKYTVRGKEGYRARVSYH